MDVEPNVHHAMHDEIIREKPCSMLNDIAFMGVFKKTSDIVEQHRAIT